MRSWLRNSGSLRSTTMTPAPRPCHRPTPDAGAPTRMQPRWRVRARHLTLVLAATLWTACDPASPTSPTPGTFSQPPATPASTTTTPAPAPAVQQPGATRHASDGVTTPPVDTPPLISDADRAAELMKQGDEALTSGRWPEAVGLYQRSIELDPEMEASHFNLGIALSRLGKIPDAIRQYEEALRVAPDYAEAHNNLGNLLVKQARPAEALPHFDAAIKVNPDHALSHNNRGTALVRLNRTPEAMDAFSKALALRPDYADARFNLGHAILRSGDIASAEAQFREVLRLLPDFAPARAALDQIATLRRNQPPAP